MSQSAYPRTLSRRLRIGLGIAAVLLASVTAGWTQFQEYRVVHSQVAWILRNRNVELALTRKGGHMAPVTFYRDTGKPIQPYYVSPWQSEYLQLAEPVLVPLRGDFFCLPFGGNRTPHQGESHPVHGEVAGADWTYGSQRTARGITTLTVSLDTRIRRGSVTKELSVVDGENVVYSRHVVRGFAGRSSVGHHATLAVPEKEGSLRIATSPIRFGMTAPGVFSDPVNREYQSFQPGKRFRDLRRVPLQFKGAPDADVTRLPARQGFCDLLLIAADGRDPAWVTAAAAEQGYLWFSLKDPAVLPSTVFWIENHGRHGSPWNGRNRCLGLEDVCAYFAEGLAASAQPNLLTREGVPTSLEFSADRPTSIQYIQGVVAIPPGFDVVRSVTFQPGKVTFHSAAGPTVEAAVRHEFLTTGQL